MKLGRGAAAALGLLPLAHGLAPPSTLSARPTCPAGAGRTSTSLSNMLRDMAAYQNYEQSNDMYARSERSGAASTNWRKNQGYNLANPAPPELGGSFATMRDAETNPYYDPGWAQSVRRDNPSRNFQAVSSYNGYNDPENPYRFGGSRGHQYPSTYPGVTSPRRTEREAARRWRNPINPYYDPVWSQSYARREDPIREGDHTEYYYPGYSQEFYGGGMRNGDGYMGGMGYGGGYGDRMYGGRGIYAQAPKAAKKRVLNGNSLMR